MGGKSSSSSSKKKSSSQADWGSILAAEREAQARQMDRARILAEDAAERERQATIQSNRLRDLQEKELTQQEADRASLAQSASLNQNAGVQATGANINLTKKGIPSNDSAPGLTSTNLPATQGLSGSPSTQSLTRFGNIFYSPENIRLGGT